MTVAVFLAWSGSFAWLLIGGGYAYFLARGYRVLLLIGAVILGAFAASLSLRRGPADHAEAHGGRWLPLAILAVPLAFLAARPRPIPGAYAFEAQSGYRRLWQAQVALGVLDHVSRRPTRSATSRPATAPSASTRPGPPGAPAGREVSTLDIVLDYPGNLGRRVATLGAVYRQDRLPADSMVVFRFVITCCAADAWPAGVLVRTNKARACPVDSWIRVEGTVGKAEVGGMEMPVILAESVIPVAAPSNPYIDRGQGAGR